MASGELIDGYDERLSGTHGIKPIATGTLEIVVAAGTTEKEEVLPKNMQKTEFFFEVPHLSQGGHLAKIQELSIRQNISFDSGYLKSYNDEGVSTGVAETVITDTTKAWTPNAYIGKYLMAADGNARGKKRRITANDETSITCAGATFLTWGMQIGDKYTICEHYSIRFSEGVQEPTLKVITDAPVNKDETFYIASVGM